MEIIYQPNNHNVLHDAMKLRYHQSTQEHLGKSPLKYWKYSPNDSKMQDLWDRFTEFKEKLFDKTSSVNNPWVIVDAEDKRVSGLNAIRYVLQSIPYEGKDEKVLDKDYPEALAILKP